MEKDTTRRIRVGDHLLNGMPLTRRREMLDGGEQVTVFGTVDIKKLNQRVRVWYRGRLEYIPVANFECPTWIDTLVR